MLCYQCFSFGHTKARCQQKITTCGNCGQHHEVVQGEQCINEAYCNRCKSNEHPTGSRKCPTYQQEDAIQHIRVDRGISYPEARRIFSASSGQHSYAGVAVQSKDLAIMELRTQIANLSRQMADKDLQIQALESRVANGPQVTGSSTDNDQRFEALNKKLDLVLAELDNKKKQINALETTVRKRDEIIRDRDRYIEELVTKLDRISGKTGKQGKSGPSNRLELVRANGTFEDVILENKLLKAQVAKVQGTEKGKLASLQNPGGKKKPLEKALSNETNRKKAKGNQSPKQDSGNESNEMETATLVISDDEAHARSYQDNKENETMDTDFAISSDEATGSPIEEVP